MTNVNPNLKTFADMYKSGYQPLFVSIGPQGAVPAQYNPQTPGQGPVLQPQPGQDEAVINGKKKMSKGKKLAIAGLALAATAAVAATAVHFLGGKSTPSDVKAAIRTASSFAEDARSTSKAVQELSDELAETVTAAQADGLAEIKGIQEAAKDVATAIKDKVDYATHLFANDGKNDAGEIIAKFFDKEGAEITDAAAKLGENVTMKYTSPTAAEELVSAVFNKGQFDNLTESTSDGKILRFIKQTVDGFIFDKGVTKLGEDASDITERYIFKGALDSLKLHDHYDDIQLDKVGNILGYNKHMVATPAGIELSESGELIKDSNFGEGYTSAKTTYFKDEGDGLKLATYEEETDPFGGPSAKLISVSDGRMENAILNSTDDIGNEIQTRINYDYEGNISAFIKETENESGKATQQLSYKDGEIFQYRTRKYDYPSEDPKQAIRTAESHVGFEENGDISSFRSLGVQDGATTEVKLDFAEGAPVAYEKAVDNVTEQTFNFDKETNRWIDPDAIAEGSADGAA